MEIIVEEEKEKGEELNFEGNQRSGGNSALNTHSFKVKSHAGIVGDEYADQVAKYQASYREVHAQLTLVEA